MFQETIIAGRVGQTPELRYTPGGDAVTSLSVAVNKTWKDRNSGETQQQTVWFRCTAWRKTAEIVSQYVTKGQQILVSGELQAPRIYTDKNGNAACSLELTVNKVTFIGSKGDSEAGPAESGPASIEDQQIPF